MRIQLSQYNFGGVSASLTDDLDEEYFRIYCRAGRRDSNGPTVKAGKTACLKAAEKLRKAAEAFERLAESDNLFNYDVQKKIGKI